jgi:hypothetical protein
MNELQKNNNANIVDGEIIVLTRNRKQSDFWRVLALIGFVVLALWIGLSQVQADSGYQPPDTTSELGQSWLFCYHTIQNQLDYPETAEFRSTDGNVDITQIGKHEYAMFMDVDYENGDSDHTEYMCIVRKTWNKWRVETILHR